MYRAIFGLMMSACVSVLAMLPAEAEVLQVKMFYPNGSMAIDARAVAIMKPGTRVDANLKELPSLLQEMPDTGGTTQLTNEAGTIRFDSSALAVLVQSPTGFAFVPLPLRRDKENIVVRPWAKLKIDLSALAPEFRKSQRVIVVWENCFAGNPPRPDVSDPFGSDTALPKHDWRFDPIIMWSSTLEAVAEQTVNVPPGEVTLMLSDEDFSKANVHKSIPYTRYAMVRALSNYTAVFKLPQVETFSGKLVDGSLPQWDRSSDEGVFVMASPAPVEMPDEFAQLFTGLDVHGPDTTLDELARRYAGEVGLMYRHELVPGALARVRDDGTFVMAQVPAGKYVLELVASPNPIPLKQRGEADDKPFTVTLTGGSSTERLIGEVVRVNSQAKLVVPGQQASTPAPAVESSAAGKEPLGGSSQPVETPVETAERQIRAALTKRVDGLDFRGVPLSRVMDELSIVSSIPILINEGQLERLQINDGVPVNIVLPAMTLQSALRHILANLSDELAFTIRDEVLLITTKADAARTEDREQAGAVRSQASAFPAHPLMGKNNTGLGEADGARGRSASVEPASESRSVADEDTGEIFVQNWLKSAGVADAGQADRAALRKALVEHLEKEFDAKLQARQAELARLRELLQQSEALLKTRQAQRGQIIANKANILLRSAPPADKEKSVKEFVQRIKQLLGETDAQSFIEAISDPDELKTMLAGTTMQELAEQFVQNKKGKLEGLLDDIDWTTGQYDAATKEFTVQTKSGKPLLFIEKAGTWRIKN